MTPYFLKQPQQDRLRQVVDSWLGTPYRHMGMNRGGVDCTKFIGMVCIELGLLADVERDYYATDWFLHGHREEMLESMDRHGQQFPTGLCLSKYQYPQPLLIGDVLCITTSPSGLCNHAGIFMGTGKMAHCINRKGVAMTDFAYSWDAKTRFVFRVEEL
jgi:cell wall-associated NlpC family hydrolase